jgi:formylglycine-generating enzyme required for sulfatase activity
MLTYSQSYALNYTISFTASGIANTLGNVQVLNLNRGTTVNVPNGYTLTLDMATAIDEIRTNNSGIRISQNASSGTSTLTFFATQTGNAQVAVYGIDGRKVLDISTCLEAGDNSFEFTLPTGLFALRVSGFGYSYTAKLQNHISAPNQTGIKFMTNTPPGVLAPQKSKVLANESIIMSYVAGDRLLYTATSGTYIANVADVPTESKTTNFIFYSMPTTLLPAGTFIMGSPTSEVNRNTNETQYTVTLTTDFRMSIYEITNAQYVAFLNAKGVNNSGLYAEGAYPTQALIYANNTMGLTYKGSEWETVPGYENAPVINVTWYGATEFATYLRGTLPTEAQWEYACRARTTTTFNAGNFLTNLQANYNWAYPYNGGTNTVTTYPGKTQTVGTYPSNAFGLYDMHGSVWEWCADWYGEYPSANQKSPTGPSNGLYRVLRGGSWNGNVQYCRSAFRNYIYPNYSNNDVGFRVVFAP